MADLRGQNATLIELSDRLAERTQELVEANGSLRAEIEERERVETAFRRSLAAADGTQTTLLERDARLRSVLETVPDAMIVIDDQGIIQSFSAAAERLFGYGAEDVIGSNVSMLMPSPYREQHDTYLARTSRPGKRG